MVWRNTKDAKHDGRDMRAEPHTTTRKDNTQVQKHNKHACRTHTRLLA